MNRHTLIGEQRIEEKANTAMWDARDQYKGGEHIKTLGGSQ